MLTFPQSIPSQDDIALAKESGRAMSAVLVCKDATQRIEFFDEHGESHQVTLPSAALRLLCEILTEIGQGNAVSVIPIHAELTTQEAADLLGVSRPFLIQLIDKGELPCRKVGTHRRICYKDVVNYKIKTDNARRQSLDELSAQAQELNMGY